MGEKGQLCLDEGWRKQTDIDRQEKGTSVLPARVKRQQDKR